jgi:hypothetical protein
VKRSSLFLSIFFRFSLCVTIFFKCFNRMLKPWCITQLYNSATKSKTVLLVSPSFSHSLASHLCC